MHPPPLSPLPRWKRASSLKMDGKENRHWQGQEGEREEGAKGGRPGGAGKELGVIKWGSGAKLPGRDRAGQAQPQ